MKKEKGFTLIELVIVLILIGLLGAIAIPKFMDLQEEAKKNALKGALATVRSAINIYYANASLKNKTEKYPQNAAVLKALLQNGKLPENPVAPSTLTAAEKAEVKVVSGIGAGNDFGTTNGGDKVGWRYNKDTGQFWSNWWTTDFHANAY